MDKPQVGDRVHYIYGHVPDAAWKVKQVLAEKRLVRIRRPSGTFGMEYVVGFDDVQPVKGEV